MSFITVVLVMLSAGAASALQVSPARSLLASAPSDIPPGCTSAGLALQSACQDEISSASAYFGVQGKSAAQLKGASFDAGKINAYLATAGSPSAKCCKASCDFNNNYCSCSAGVLDIIKSFTGNDLGVYSSTATFFGEKCKSGKTFLGNTCPSDIKTAVKSPNKC